MTILRTTIYAKREICTCDWKNTYEIFGEEIRGRRTTWKWESKVNH
jgi:hypothetical protein